MKNDSKKQEKVIFHKLNQLKLYLKEKQAKIDQALTNKSTPKNGNLNENLLNEIKKSTNWIQEKALHVNPILYQNILTNMHLKLSNQKDMMKEKIKSKDDVTNFYSIALFIATSVFLYNLSLFLMIIDSKIISVFSIFKKRRINNSLLLDKKIDIDWNEIVQHLNNNVMNIIGNIKKYKNTLLSIKKQGTQYDKNMERLLPQLCHELRTPLHIIMGYTQVLLMNENNTLSEQQINMLKKIIHSGHYLNDIIDDIGEMAKNKDYSLNIIFERVKINEILDEVIELMIDMAKKHDVKICKAYSTNDEMYIHLDKRRMKQILINLLTNGIKYNQRGGKVIISSTVSKNNIYISVKDTGIGIKPNNLDKIFHPFVRFASDNIPGKGLGLSFVKEVTEEMGGKIQIQSEINKGSEFIIEFPIHNKGFKD